MDNLHKKLIQCSIEENALLNIVQGGVTLNTQFFYETRSDSDVFIFEYVLSGKGYIVIDDKLYTVNQGDLYIIPTHKTYEYFADSEKGYERVWIVCYGKLLENLYSTYFGSAPLIISNFVQLESMLNVLQILENYSHNDKDFEALSQAIFAIFATLNSHLCKVDSFPTILSKSVASRIKSYLISHAKEKFDLNSLTKVFNMSKNQIINTFKKAYKITPNKFFITYKLTLAEEMLKRGMTNKEIAEELDFCDENYFSKLFIKYKGIKPSSI